MASNPSASTPSPSPAAPDAPSAQDPRLVPVIVVLAIVAALLMGLIGFLTIRARKRKADSSSSSGPFHGTTIWEREHPAAQITPFGAPRNAPRFNHVPGTDMRIAYRRPDGAWHFADSRTPFNPEGVKDLENTPTPTPMSAASTMFFPFSPRYNPSVNESSTSLAMYADNPMSAKEQEVRAYRLAAARPRTDKDKPAREEWSGYYDPVTPPPPAYRRDPRLDDNS